MLTIPNRINLLSLALVVIVAPLASGQPYNEDFKFIPDDLPWGYSFGRHVSIDQGLFTAGAIYWNSEGNEFGAAYGFKLSDPSNGFELSAGDGGKLLWLWPAHGDQRWDYCRECLRQ